MKGILRGLYNSIFRRLPLKLLLILLAVFSVLFACFSNAGYLYFDGMEGFALEDDNDHAMYLSCGNRTTYYIELPENISIQAQWEEVEDPDGNYGARNGVATVDCSTCPTCPSCPSCPDTPTCDYSGYILESDITQQYCVSNGLCPSSDCPIYTGDNSWSALYINDIQHEGAGLININIPEEISWDYSNENDTFSLDVEGYNVDPDYINAIIGTQTYTPDSNDFSKVVSDIIPLFVPGLVVILFLYFVFRFIKKIF